MAHTVGLFQQWDSDGEFNRLGCARAGLFLDSMCDVKRKKGGEKKKEETLSPQLHTLLKCCASLCIVLNVNHSLM